MTNSSSALSPPPLPGDHLSHLLSPYSSSTTISMTTVTSPMVQLHIYCRRHDHSSPANQLQHSMQLLYHHLADTTLGSSNFAVCVNDFLHCAQVWGFSPVWMSIWVLRFPAWLDHFLHSVHLCGFSPLWVSNWACVGLCDWGIVALVAFVRILSSVYFGVISRLIRWKVA